MTCLRIRPRNDRPQYDAYVRLFCRQCQLPRRVRHENEPCHACGTKLVALPPRGAQ